MDEKRISLIIYKRDEMAHDELLAYLGNLQIPDGYCADVVTVEGEIGKPAAYNEGIKRSNAKYKLYIDEKARILKYDFLQRMLDVFAENETIGILGVAGSQVIPVDGICETGIDRVGRLIFGKTNQKKQWGGVAGAYQEVMALDDCVLMTQQDIAWRDDLFTKEGFYATAQCIEFKRQGFYAAVLAQDDFWVQDRREMFYYDTIEQERFLDEYSKDIYPLVSVIIPTFNRPVYFELALKSVLNQTYRNIEVFITDNSTNEETKNLMQSYLAKDSRIQYEYHPEFDAAGNWTRARIYNNPAAKYVNWLMDDDLFMPNKIAVMMNYSLSHPLVSLVTSSRQLIDADGTPMEADWAKPIVEKTAELAGEMIGADLLCKQVNFIGEPTTVLIKKEHLKNNDLGWSGMDGRYLVSDFPTWLQLLSQGNMIYIPEPLSCFRQHDGQEQASVFSRICSVICWAFQVKYASQNEIFLKSEEKKRIAVIQWLQMAVGVLKDANQQTFFNEDVQNLQIIFQAMAQALNKGCHIDFLIDAKYKKTVKRCACCGHIVDQYLPLPMYYREEFAKYDVQAWKDEMVNEDAYTCKYCGAADRERAYAIWMERELPKDNGIRILDIAPSRALSQFIQRVFPMADYRTGDLFMDGVDYHLDIMDMVQIADNSVDFFICSHVLEHVANDIKAMQELKRILKPNGRGILVVPLDLNQVEIDEDPSCNDIAERWRRFGQDDHLRKYSQQGYLERLKKVGFQVQQYKKDYFGQNAMWDNDLTDTVNVYIVSK